MAHPALAEARTSLPHEVVVEAVRRELARMREVLRTGEARSPGADVTIDVGELARRAAATARDMLTPSLRHAINATGVVIHTNLGRAPLSRRAIEAIARTAAYSNLEYDLQAGERGSRYVHAVQILRRVTGCEDALVVNNNAAALVLSLAALGAGREAIVSRGQLVEIGGGFRIPEIMRQSGARLVEVGTTNRTYLDDYRQAITPDTAILLRVHTSNFRILGFTTAPSVEELARLAHEHGLIMIDDVGSGALLDTTRFGLAPEPMVQASLRAGADLVLFSGDKLLGGPQCGIITGRASPIARLRKHPLARALRVDKLTLAALEATLTHYLLGEAETEVPVWRMITTPPDALRARAEQWAQRLQAAGVACSVERGESAVGGGSLPGEALPTWLVSIQPQPPQQDAGRLALALRQAPTPVIARVEHDVLLLDPRTVQDDEVDMLIQEVISAAHERVP
jgi:L-seryl-tRNA(Ser) seleniumtransferase